MVTVNAGRALWPVLRTPSRSSVVSPRRCLVGNSAVTIFTGYLPAASLESEDASLPPQAAIETVNRPAAAPAARACRHERRPYLRCPPKAAGTYHGNSRLPGGSEEAWPG